MAFAVLKWSSARELSSYVGADAARLGVLRRMIGQILDFSKAELRAALERDRERRREREQRRRITRSNQPHVSGDLSSAPVFSCYVEVDGLKCPAKVRVRAATPQDGKTLGSPIFDVLSYEARDGTGQEREYLSGHER